MPSSPESARLEQLERRVQADPNSIAFAALAEEYRRAGRFPDAVGVCRAGLARHPAYLSARVTLGRALIELGALDDARSELQHVLKVAPENLAAIRALADIHHRRGELPEATDHYRSALTAVDGTPATPLPAGEAGALSFDQLAEIVRNATPAPPQAAADPALKGLERFLEAILATRQADEARGSLSDR